MNNHINISEGGYPHNARLTTIYCKHERLPRGHKIQTSAVPTVGARLSSLRWGLSAQCQPNVAQAQQGYTATAQNENVCWECTTTTTATAAATTTTTTTIIITTTTIPIPSSVIILIVDSHKAHISDNIRLCRIHFLQFIIE